MGETENLFFRFGYGRDHFHDFEISGRVHDSQPQLSFIFGDTRILQIIQEKTHHFKKYYLANISISEIMF